MIKSEDLPNIARRFQTLRVTLGFTQEEMAEKFGVTTRTWQNWETGKTKPIKPILTLLSQLENKRGMTFSEWCVSLRKTLDISKSEMARKIGILPNTWIDWEKGRHKPNIEARKKLEEYVASLKQQGILNPSLEDFANL